MARAPYEIAGTQVKAGTRQTVEVPVAKLYTHTPLHIPVEVVHGPVRTDFGWPLLRVGLRRGRDGPY